MKRDINLINYLPIVFQDIKELKCITNVENNEIKKLYENSDRVLNNLFIYHADEYGIRRYEEILGIKTRENEDLELRRFRVIARYNDEIPNTYERLKNKLNIICGEDNYYMKEEFEKYKLEIKVSLKLRQQLEELDRMLYNMIPANIEIICKSEIIELKKDNIYIFGTVVENLEVTVNSKTKENYAFKDNKFMSIVIVEEINEILIKLLKKKIKNAKICIQ